MALTVASLNMHGFNQGKQFLSELCSTADVIFVQEHWLQSHDCNKLNRFTDRFVGYSVSAMDVTVQSGILRGRPFGGVGVLIKNQLMGQTKFLLSHERCIAAQIGNILFCNVYLPPAGSANYIETIADVLSMIGLTIQQCDCTYVAVGGDLNIDFNRDTKSESFAILQSFMDEHTLISCDNLMSCQNDYTYKHTSLDCSSYIDHYFVNAELFRCVTGGCITDSGVNFSDHLAIVINVNVDLSMVIQDDNGKCSVPTTHRVKMKDTRLRWDKADLAQYYSCTYNLLQYVNTDGFQDDCCDVSRIDELYSSICQCLKIAATSCVPSTSSNFYKWWWNDNLHNLKNESLAAHRLWIDNGRPHHGVVFEIARAAKAKYKHAIRQADKDYVISVSDELHDWLLKKDQFEFWQSWHRKFGCDKKNVSCIDGSCDPEIIASKFASVFQSTCKTNESVNCKFKNEFLSMYEQYALENVGNDTDLRIDVELIDKCLRHMKTRKAPGFDGIDVEHMLYGHPIVVWLLSVLYNAILRYGYVPAGFGNGIIVPLIKDRLGNVSDIKNYRGITLSSSVAKLFEMCVLELVQEKLTTSNLQFGFKKKLSCSHAIHTMQSVVEYYTNRGSTMNACVLDITKAFDKVNHYCMYIKLMHRKVPLQFLNVIIDWYSKCFACVRWNDTLSSVFQLSGGVRQGGVLSPVFFILYVNDIIEDLQKQGLGCHVGDLYVGCIMYADDLVLLSSSLTTLQLMVDRCKASCEALGLSLNVNKSVVMRIGRAFKHECCKIQLGVDDLNYVNVVKYLGVQVCSASKFKLSYDGAKSSFYRALNGLLCKTKGKFDDIVMLQLMNAYCKPLLLYGSEVYSGSRTFDAALRRAWSYAFWKIFGVSEDVACDIQLFTGIRTLEDTLKNRRVRFRRKLPYTDNDVIIYMKDFMCNLE